MHTRIGIISDTHGLLRPEAVQCLAGVSHIIHGGDIGRAEVLDGLRRIAPVTAIRGNIDVGDWADSYPDTAAVQLGGRPSMSCMTSRRYGSIRRVAELTW